MSLEVRVPPPVEAAPPPEDIPLDIVFEDEHLLVINKAVGMVVHPGAGNPSGTLVNALLHYCGDSLSGIGGVARPGIVHRLDKETSGLIVVAKNDKAHQGLSDQLSDRSLSRLYTAFVWKAPVPLKGKIDQPIGRHKTQRTKMALRGERGREAVTRYHMKEQYGAAASKIECKLLTGRTHQIRVHMGYLKTPIDPFRQDNRGFPDASGCFWPETACFFRCPSSQSLFPCRIAFWNVGKGKNFFLKNSASQSHFNITWPP